MNVPADLGMSINLFSENKYSLRTGSLRVIVTIREFSALYILSPLDSWKEVNCY